VAAVLLVTPLVAPLALHLPLGTPELALGVAIFLCM
jgi:hypothetical protein